MDKKAIFDFDKTLISINSFTYWVFFLCLATLKDLNFKLFFRISSLIFFRKLTKSLSHEDFKRKLLLLNYKEEYDRIFCSKLYKHINNDILKELIELKKLKYRLVISSAAPERYLKLFVQSYIKTDQILVVGSVVVGDDFFKNNYKENKLKRLIQLNFIDKDEMYDFLYTDSEDDIFLARNAKKIYLVSPTQKTLNFYKNIYPAKIQIKKA